MNDVFDVAALQATIRRDETGRRLCSMPDCNRVHKSRGMCKRHHQRWRYWANPEKYRAKRRTGEPPGRPRTQTLTPAWLDLDRLARTTPAEGWERNGACYQSGDTGRFYKDGALSPDDIAICVTCQARYACLAAAIAQIEHDDHGIWGGTSRRQRIRIRRAVKAQREQGQAA